MASALFAIFITFLFSCVSAVQGVKKDMIEMYQKCSILSIAESAYELPHIKSYQRVHQEEIVDS